MMPNIVSADRLLPKSAALTLKSVQSSESGWLLEARGPARARCPACRRVSFSRHSRYWRTLKDLPAHGANVTLKVQVNRWRCRNESCAVRFFTAPLGGVVGRYARETNRAGDLILLIGHAVGGLPGERLMSRLNIPTSDDTILRRLKHVTQEDAPAEPQVIGVDEWAWAKGQSFGTIVVDLKRSRVADLLPESSAESLAAWLKAHPGVMTISRDRHGRYAEGGREGAPEATQVADRFHLVRSLREAVEKELAVHRKELRISLSSHAAPPAKPDGEKQTNPVRVFSQVVARRREVMQQRHQEKLELFQRIHKMKAAGMRVSEISRQLCIHRKRIDQWIRLAELPERNRMQPHSGSVESFREYLRERWEQGCQHGHKLLAEIRQRGYTGCYSHLARFLSPWRQPRPEPEAEFASADAERKAEATIPPGARQISPKVAAALLSKTRPELTAKQAETVDILKNQCPDFAVMRKLSIGFRTILSRGKVATLHRWLDQARRTHIYSLGRFVRTVQQDIKAVESAVKEKWSNGPVEGQINRLKALKRQMYGRAGVELLRARVLPLPLLEIK